jgi:hypothetical protein
MAEVIPDYLESFDAWLKYLHLDRPEMPGDERARPAWCPETFSP